MNRKRIVPWWESLGVGAPAPADAAPDPADLGTAFGLDASFSTAHGELDPHAAASPSGDGEAPPRLRFPKLPPRQEDAQ